MATASWSPTVDSKTTSSFENASALSLAAAIAATTRSPAFTGATNSDCTSMSSN